MGEKLPYYCRVKKILAAVKNGPKLARPVVKSALEKLSLSVWKQFSNNPNGRTACPCPDLCVTRHRLPARHCSATMHHCCTVSSVLYCIAQWPSVNKATSVSVKGDDNNPPDPWPASLLSNIIFCSKSKSSC